MLNLLIPVCILEGLGGVVFFKHGSIKSKCAINETFVWILLWEEMAFENTSIARHLLSTGQRKYCFHYDRFTGQVTEDNVLSHNGAHLYSKK